MALATLHLTAIPVLAGLVAGTGAVAFMGNDRPVQTAALSTETTPAATAKSCDAQTWPYIEQRCLAGPANADKASVRMVSAPASAPVPQTNTTPPAPQNGSLISRDTVLRAPNYFNDVPAVPGNLASDQKMTRKQVRREVRKQRNERRMNAQAYQVPSETRYGDRPVIVVRPLRLEAFR